MVEPEPPLSNNTLERVLLESRPRLSYNALEFSRQDPGRKKGD
jgi:hypothetical protein